VRPRWGWDSAHVPPSENYLTPNLPRDYLQVLQTGLAPLDSAVDFAPELIKRIILRAVLVVVVVIRWSCELLRGFLNDQVLHSRHRGPPVQGITSKNENPGVKKELPEKGKTCREPLSTYKKCSYSVRFIKAGWTLSYRSTGWPYLLYLSWSSRGSSSLCGGWEGWTLIVTWAGRCHYGRPKRLAAKNLLTR